MVAGRVIIWNPFLVEVNIVLGLFLPDFAFYFTLEEILVVRFKDARFWLGIKSSGCVDTKGSWLYCSSLMYWFTVGEGGDRTTVFLFFLKCKICFMLIKANRSSRQPDANMLQWLNTVVVCILQIFLSTSILVLSCVRLTSAFKKQSQKIFIHFILKSKQKPSTQRNVGGLLKSNCFP